MALPLVILTVAGLMWTVSAPDPLPNVEPPMATAAVKPHSWFAPAIHGARPVKIAEVPLSRQVDALRASGDPEDAYKAYAPVRDCVYFAQDGELYSLGKVLPGAVMPELIGMSPETKAQQARLCKDVTQRMLTSRFDHLAIAARAGVGARPGISIPPVPSAIPAHW